MIFQKHDSITMGIMTMFTAIVEAITDQQKVIEQQEQQIQDLTKEINLIKASTN